MTFAPTMDGKNPFYSSFGSSIYASDIIVEAIRCKSNEFMKLDPRHIVDRDGKQIERRDSSVSRILRKPNGYMTTSDFLQKIEILLELNKNVFTSLLLFFVSPLVTAATSAKDTLVGQAANISINCDLTRSSV